MTTSDDSEPNRLKFTGDSGVEDSFGPLVDAEEAPAGPAAQWRLLRRALAGPVVAARTRAGSWLVATVYVGPALVLGIAETLGVVAGANRRFALVGVAGALVLWMSLGTSTVRYGRIAAGRVRFDVRTDADPLWFALANLAAMATVAGVGVAVAPTGRPIAEACGLAAVALGPLGSILLNGVVNGDRANGIITFTQLALLSGISYAVLHDAAGIAAAALWAGFAVLAVAFFATLSAADKLAAAPPRGPRGFLAVLLALPYALLVWAVADDAGRPRADRWTPLLVVLLALAVVAPAGWRRRPARFRRPDLRPPAPESASEAWNQSGWRLILAGLSFVVPGIGVLLNPIDVIDRPPGDPTVVTLPAIGPTTRTITIPQVDASGRVVERTVQVPDQAQTGWRTVTLAAETHPATGGQAVVGWIGIAGGAGLGVYGLMIFYRARRRRDAPVSR